jgi:surface polysaccharide O-acyltransferase-like enzyme
MSQQERVYAVDLARGLAVAFMIWVHVLLTYSTPEVVNSIFGIIIAFLGSPPAAPVFMTLMGLSFYYSRNKDLKSGIRRGLQIILFGYLLNFFRGVLPVYMTGLLAPSKAAGIPAAVADYMDAFLELDILQFAGLAFIVMSLIRYWKVNKYVLLFLALVIAVISPYMWGF